MKTIIALFVIALTTSVLSIPLSEVLGRAEFSTLKGLIDANGVTYQNSGVTLFAPDNDAFSTNRSDTYLTSIQSDDAVSVLDVLAYHLLNGGGAIMAADLTDGAVVTTTYDIVARQSASDWYFNGYAMFLEEIVVDEGVVHRISGVLEPPQATDGATGAVNALTRGDFDSYSTLATVAVANNLAIPAGMFTFFAPNDDGLTRTPESDVLLEVLSYHILEGALAFYVDAAAIATAETTLPNGWKIRINEQYGTVTVNGQAVVTNTDIFLGNNSVMHTITQGYGGMLGYLIPADYDIAMTLKALGLGYLVDAIVATNLPTAGIKTLFAPESLATGANVTADFLAYHGLGSVVMSSDLEFPMAAETLSENSKKFYLTATTDMMNMFVNGVQFSMSPSGMPYLDIQTDETFVVHVIDETLPYPTTDIATAASTVDDLSTLLNLLGVAGVSVPTDTGVTLFAPTNQAFLDLEEAVPGVTDYLIDNPDVLADVILFHLIGGNHVLFSSQLAMEAIEPETLNGDDLMIDLANGMINSAEVTVSTADIFCTNGVVHIVNTVLVPPNFTMEEMSSGEMTSETSEGEETTSAGEEMTSDDDSDSAFVLSLSISLIAFLF